jgi:uncharacterized protein YndB with AHSA1/START domain
MTVSKAPARAFADLDEGTVLASVEIAAPPERVFDALTDPKQLVAWWGSPDTYQTEEWAADVRVGGRWRARGRSADGKPYTVEGEFLEVDPPRKLVHTWIYDWDGGRSTTVAYRLEPIDGGTRVRLRHWGFGDRIEACRQHGQGWERVLGWLRAHITAPRYFYCRLIPPRTTFGQTMSESEKQIMQRHVAYWTKQAELGVAIVFGPVADPAGGWGVAILRARGAEEVAALQRNDPAFLSGLGFRYETLPMPRAVVGVGVARAEIEP